MPHRVRSLLHGAQFRFAGGICRACHKREFIQQKLQNRADEYAGVPRFFVKALRTGDGSIEGPADRPN